VLREINATCCAPPLPPREVERIAKNIAKKPAGSGAGAVSRGIFDRCRAQVVQLRNLSLSVPWRGRSASTDVAVLQALYSIAFECGRVGVQASLRQIAERAGIESFRTVARAAGRLHRRGWLKRTQRGGYTIKRSAENELPTASSIWRLTRPRQVLQTEHINAATWSLNVLPCNSVCCTSATDAGFDVSSCNADMWRRGGFGLTARRIWQALSPDRTVTAAHLAGRLGCHRSTVTRLLRGKLKSCVVREPTGWRRNGQEPALTFLRLQRQRREHTHDRERFADVIHHLRQRRGRLVLRDPLPMLLLNTVQTHDARRLVAWLIAVHEVSQQHSQRTRRVQ
jgi:Mn-dependent DtxR family transcriptional regulator